MFLHPYQELHHHLPGLLKYKDKERPSSLRAEHATAFNDKYGEHIELLKGYLYSKSNLPVKDCKGRVDSKSHLVSFASYWVLLKPGRDVYVREEGVTMNAYILHQVSGSIGEENGEKSCRALLGQCLEFDV